MKLNSRRTLTAGAAFAIAAMYVLLLWDTRGLPTSLYGSPGPGVWPRIVFVLMLAVALYLAFDMLRSDDDSAVLGSGARYATGLMALALIYLIAAERAGFLLMTALFLLAGMWMLHVRSWKLFVGVGIGFPVVVYLVFVKLAGAEFPPGLLAPLIGG